ncbi:hypothetical protein CJ010_21675 [Azoarcus sp. DD4]|uniref:acyltransferase family protein n=1 Tax=Azoarcus sp. DD4 TaxID=2027405 RepID=UPI001128A27C|nr:acyltransferase family protein [Azoarcus sp. DD4]QDF98958.1 hypothetical protein CJ010_21675 [Azoarcus sp. DD4]
MSKPTPHLAYRPDIDGLRAIAVLSVVIFHAFPASLPGGFVGVDIFFVISGYLISSILYKALAADGFSFADFYARRVRRIFPALLLVVFAVLLIGWTVLFPDEYAQLGKHAAAGLGFVANIVLWRETGYFDNAAELKPFLHLWSLGIEEQFYILWPVVALLAWRLRIDMGRVIVALLAASLLACVALTLSDRASSYFLPLTRAWELLAGALLAWRGHSVGGLPAVVTGRPADRMAYAGLALLLLALVFIDEDSHFPGAWALLPVVGAVLLMAAGPQATLNRHLLSNRLLVGIGLISFPLYLWHWPLLSLARIVFPAPSAWLIGAAVCLAVALAWLTWRLVERPLRHGRGMTVAALAVSAVLVAGLGASVSKRDGLPFRLKDAQAAKEAGALEWTDALGAGEDCRRLLPAGFPGTCLAGDASRPADAMLIGDSHANHYYWGLSSELAAMGVNLLQVAEAGCPLLYGLDVHKSDAPLHCRQIATAALDHAVSRPEVHTVFLSARWVAAMTGTQLKGLGDEARQLRPLLVEGGKEIGRDETIARALDGTLARLVAAGKRVVVLESVPELDFNARECIAWTPNRFVSRTPRPDCTVARELIDARARAYRPRLAEVFARHPQVAVLDPLGLMCDERACYGRRDGVLLYRDDDHLSLDGSHWLARQLRPQLTALLERPVVAATGLAMTAAGEGTQ